jgi:hypothetical protein
MLLTHGDCCICCEEQLPPPSPQELLYELGEQVERVPRLPDAEARFDAYLDVLTGLPEALATIAVAAVAELQRMPDPGTRLASLGRIVGQVMPTR